MTPNSSSLRVGKERSRLRAKRAVLFVSYFSEFDPLVQFISVNVVTDNWIQKYAPVNSHAGYGADLMSNGGTFAPQIRGRP